MINFIPKIWVLALGSGVASYLLFEKNQDHRKKLHQTKLDLKEQQRTIDRLRAELGKERHLRQEAEAKQEETDDKNKSI